MKTILIIEDDPIITHIYRTHIEKEGYAVETASDGLSGFDRAHTINPAAILLDLMLPKMNGIEFLKKIRSDAKFAAIPILVFTNAYLPNMLQDATSAGASHIFNKATLTPKQLLDCLCLVVHGTNRPPREEPASERPSDALAANNQFFEEHPGSPPPPANYGYNNTQRGSAPATRDPGINQLGFDNSFLDSDVYRDFVATRPVTISDLRGALQEFIKSRESGDGDQHLLYLYRQVHALTARAGMAKFADIAQVTSALEVILKDLHEQPKHITVSTLRTINQSVEFIAELLTVCEPRGGDLPMPNILVVDDEVLSRRAIGHALEKGNLKSIEVGDPVAAIKMIEEAQFDLIVLDIQMPSVDGFELCKRIRSVPANQNTPVLFVTSLTDFQNRAKSTMCGGNDFIAKPFLFIEVTIKAIILLMRKRLLPRMKAMSSS